MRMLSQDICLGWIGLGINIKKNLVITDIVMKMRGQMVWTC